MNISRTTVHAAIAALIVAFTAHAETVTGKVIGVADGDTVTVLTEGPRQVKVRIAGIDAPEKGQAFGQAAKKVMSDCAFGQVASVDWKKLDRYGRAIGKLTVDSIDCGLRQIELGLAWHYKAYEREQTPADRSAYAEAENAARLASTGLWIDARPTPPWEFRRIAEK
ncbi:endonuclease YncB(thermonuclease family) [Paucibacter oligotrophus]|uniref:Endonuclease YncB(Thermonuclease family) n=1 Tax=Roseateles oligotrophus TaxID=1769250 RepID=A0A840L8V8_9BURK|nr:thermonuclease family protein [Roseateles oligotrophus]MBB4843193.1 endonuclease YncB(thermonuclease family) [Roseateles oligotrophus]